MSRYANNAVCYAPFYIHTFHLVQPHLTVDAEKFNIRYTDPSQIDNTPDKLRWYRYNRGLLQKQVADYAGIYRSTYCSYEDAGRDYYPIKTMEKIAELYNVPVVSLLDEYNLFLYYGQGAQIRALRNLRGLTQKQYAEYLGVPYGTLKQWEIDRVQISKQTWEILKLRG